MIISYDGEAKALYITLMYEFPVLTVAINDMVNVDISSGGAVIGLEVLSPATTDWDVEKIITNYQIDFSVADALIKCSERKEFFKDL